MRAVIALLVLAIGATAARAAPKAELWERWLAHDASSTAIIDHSAWDRFLERHVRIGGDGINRVDYGAVRAGERKAIKAYLAGLSGVPVGRYGRAEQFAFWVNLYNATTVDLILDSYPVASIRDIDNSPGLLAKGPWGAPLAEVDGIVLSLDDIEHRILRPIWRDPRVHYAVSCASIGCPNLAPLAFTAENSDRLLSAGARAYVNHPRGARVEGGKLVVSKLYRWYADDFGGKAGVIAHLKRYAEPALAAAIGDRKKYSARGYDWALNDARADRD